MNFEEIKRAFRSISETIYFDETQYLREQTTSPAIVKEFIIEAEILLQKTSDPEEIYFLLSAMGYCYRVLNQADRAIIYFVKCLKFIEKNPKKKMVTLIRLGEAYKYDNQHERALELFEEAQHIRINYAIQGYEDFIFQHQAKCLIELGKIDVAKHLLLKALEIRIDKGDQALIESTNQVLQLIKK